MPLQKKLFSAATDVQLTLVLKKCATFKYTLNIDYKYRLELCPPMPLSKSKCWYSNYYLHFLKCAVPLQRLTGSIRHRIGKQFFDNLDPICIS
jgi:hypothetical protein